MTDEKKTCDNCGGDLLDGECTNPHCEDSPYYEEEWDDEDWEEDEDGGEGEEIDKNPPMSEGLDYK